ncbi:hypothetical protein Tco_1229769, partial [Tanacetum coccineum]
DSLLLTPLCCDDIRDVTPRVSALAGYDRLVSEPVLFRPTGYSITYDSKEEPIEEEPLEEPNEEGYLEESDKEADSDLLSDARSRPRPAESGDSCEGKVKPKKSNPSEAQHKFIPSFTSSRCY